MTWPIYPVIWGDVYRTTGSVLSPRFLLNSTIIMLLMDVESGLWTSYEPSLVIDFLPKKPSTHPIKTSRFAETLLKNPPW